MWLRRRPPHSLRPQLPPLPPQLQLRFAAHICFPHIYTLRTHDQSEAHSALIAFSFECSCDLSKRMRRLLLWEGESPPQPVRSTRRRTDGRARERHYENGRERGMDGRTRTAAVAVGSRRCCHRHRSPHSASAVRTALRSRCC